METNSSTSIDARRLRGILAEERITRTRFAQVCGLDRAYLTHILNGYREPGELAAIKIERGLRKLGLCQDANGDGNHAA